MSATGRLIEHDDIETVDGTYSYDESDESKAFREFKSSFDDEKMGTLRVHRVPESKTQRNKGAIRTIYLFSCTIDQFDFDSLLEYLRDHYGGGTYRLIGSRSGSSGVAFNRLVDIEAPIDHGFMGKLNKDDPLRPGDQSADIIDRMGAVLLESQTRQEEMFRDLAGPRTGGDAFDQMTKMMTAVGTMMTAMGVKPQEPQSVTDKLTEWKLLQKLFDGRGGGGDGGAESNIYSLLTETIKSFGPALGLAIAAQQKSGAIPLSGPVPAMLPNPAAEETEKSQLSAELEAMRPQINFLVGQAKAGAKPADVAAALIPGIAEENLESIEAFLLQENVVDICVQVNSDIQNWREWFVEWRDIMLKTLAKMFEEEPDHAAEGLRPGDSGFGAEKEPLTALSKQEQTAQAVAGADTDVDDTESAESSAATPSEHSSDLDELAAGSGGD